MATENFEQEIAIIIVSQKATEGNDSNGCGNWV
jgi:hypothetical protein